MRVLHIAASAYPWPIVVECFYLSVDSECTMAGIFSVFFVFCFCCFAGFYLFFIVLFCLCKKNAVFPPYSELFLTHFGGKI